MFFFLRIKINNRHGGRNRVNDGYNFRIYNVFYDFFRLFTSNVARVVVVVFVFSSSMLMTFVMVNVLLFMSGNEPMLTYAIFFSPALRWRVKICVIFVYIFMFRFSIGVDVSGFLTIVCLFCYLCCFKIKLHVLFELGHERIHPAVYIIRSTHEFHKHFPVGDITFGKYYKKV